LTNTDSQKKIFTAPRIDTLGFHFTYILSEVICSNFIQAFWFEVSLHVHQVWALGLYMYRSSFINEGWTLNVCA